MSDDRFDLIGLGECMVELWSDGPLAEALTLHRGYGGDVLNALVMASRLGARSAFVSRVGDDPFASGLLAAWRAEGIDTSASPVVNGINGVYFISVGAGGERSFTYRRSGSAASFLSPADVEDGPVDRAAAVLLSGITQALSPSAEAATLRAAERARAGGALVAFDPNYRSALWDERGRREGQDGRELAAAAAAALLPLTSLALPSGPADAAVVALHEADPATLARAFAERGAEAVALKLGAQGSFVWRDGEGDHVPPAPVAEARDTTGAGDAWNAALLVALLRGADLQSAAAWANEVAAWQIGHRGAVPRERPPEALAARYAERGRVPEAPVPGAPLLDSRERRR
jgi:2-dehydro-3-deoxygluconokinase